LKVEARSLTKQFGDTVALDGLDLILDGPGMVGYLGPNGAGKTTTLKLFTNLLFPTSGEAFVDGLSVQRETTKALENVSALIESPEPYPYQTTEEFLRFVANVRGLNPREATARIAKLRDLVMLDDVQKKTGKLSKGNKQRVMLAAALLPESEIILLDEPTAGLDPGESKEVRTILKDLKRERLIVMSSHIMFEVSDACDRIAFINKGKLVLFDSVENIESKLSSGRGAEGLEEAYMRLIQGK
jgi:ABC-2 type transport system ATP-binding protein